MESYLYSIDEDRITTIKIKRSKFICSMAPVATIADAKQFISKISKENKTANHNCWAYIIGDKGDTYHSSDSGEPSGTAGKPMLNIMQSNHMTQIAAVVTRYFGGVKLGVRGLIDAYGASVAETIGLDNLKKLVEIIRIKVEVVYEFNDIFLNQVNPYCYSNNETQYTDIVTHIIEIEKKVFSGVEEMLGGYQSQGKVKFQILEQG